MMGRQSYSTKHIEYLEKDFLDNFGGRIDVSSLTFSSLGEVRVLKVDGVSNFWEVHREKIASLRLFMEDMISGFYEGGIPLIFAIFGKKDEVEILIGTHSYQSRHVENSFEVIETSLRSTFQGIDVEKLATGYLNDKIRNFAFAGLVTGTPTEKGGKEEKFEIEKIERVIRGFFGRECGYLVIANPTRNSDINSLYNSVLNEMRIVTTSDRSMGIENPTQKRYQKLLEAYLDRLQLAKAQGMWNTSILLFADDQETLNHVKALIKSVFGGRESVPDRIRTFDVRGKISNLGLILNPSPASPGQFTYPYSFLNLLNSADLAVFIHLPSQEMPGFQIKPYARFKVAVRGSAAEKIDVGPILDQGNEIGISYGISTKALKKHGLIVGATGSGKTNTLFYLLKDAWAKHAIPFLVIEPAKTEYRKLLLSEEVGRDLRVFTLGNNNVSPFRINPFEIRPGVSVQTHIDLLKSVFNAAFYMWGPLPHVLERCLHEIYADRGWDLSSNKNTRGLHINIHPTLTDLYNKIDEVVDSLGYSPESTMEIRSSLKTRINSLRIGGKGLMIDTRNSIPFESLLEKPTVLELEYIGDDDEKSFMMGLILTMMYEYHVSKGIVEEGGLQHITVIEEAHRLLANYGQDNPYLANVKGKAVEAFTNILSEIRAYGEGFLIAEQIPTKLAPDVIKNTNLKVMHRIVSEDDRRVMGAAMNIEAHQTRKVASFTIGEAAVYSEGDDGAYHVQVLPAKIKKKWEGKGDEHVMMTMESFRKSKSLLAPFGGCKTYCNAICRYKSLGDAVSTTRQRFPSLTPSLVLSLMADPTLAEPILLELFELGRQEAEKVKDPKGIKICSVIHASERYFEDIGSKYVWSYEDVERLKSLFLEFYIDALEKHLDSETAFSSEVFDKSKIGRFQSCYRALCHDKQPTRFCPVICPDKLCLYRFNLSEALKDKRLDERFEELVRKGPSLLSPDEDPVEIWIRVNALCKEAAEEVVLPGGDEESLRKISLCFALQKLYSAKPPYNRRYIEVVIRLLLDLAKRPYGFDETLDVDELVDVDEISDLDETMNEEE